MFDLERAIAEWRKQMAAAGVKNGEVLNELESHLRDDIQREIQVGRTANRAFEIAVERIGGAQAIKGEFAKIGRPPMALLRKLQSFLFGSSGMALPPLSVFTADARQTLELAREEAPRLNHDFIGTEHVLLGLLKSQSGIVPNVMRRLGIECGAIRTEIEKVIGPGLPAERAGADIPYTPRAKRALTLAVQEAGALQQEQINPEHIFLGLIKEGSGLAALVLKNLGVDIKRTRAEIINEMNLRRGAG